MTFVLGYGVYAAISDKLNPKLTAAFYTYYLTSNLLATVIGAMRSYDTYPLPAYVGAIVYDIVFIVISIRFFCGERARRPIALYIMIAIEVAVAINNFLLNVLNASNEIFRDIFSLCLFDLMQDIFFFVLLAFMTYTLDKKRKRAAR